jgi:hypothetical protein
MPAVSSAPARCLYCHRSSKSVIRVILDKKCKQLLVCSSKLRFNLSKIMDEHVILPSNSGLFHPSSQFRRNQHIEGHSKEGNYKISKLTVNKSNKYTFENGEKRTAVLSFSNPSTKRLFQSCLNLKNKKSVLEEIIVQ